MLLARSYSHHSLLSAITKIPDLIQSAKQRGYTTIALTDEDSGSAFIEFYDECKKQDMKATLGCTLKVANVKKNESSFGRNKEFSKVALLSKNNQGYKNLLELITLARIEQEDPIYHLNLSDISKYKKEGELDFFVVLAGNDHEIISNLRLGKESLAEDILTEYIEACGSKNILVELSCPLDSDNPKEVEKFNQTLAKICEKNGVRYVASWAPRYLNPEDSEAFKVVLAIRDQKKLSQIELDRDFSMLSVEELKQKFNYLEKACDTKDIENEINLEVRTDYDKHADEAFFPHFELPEGQDYATRLVWESYINLLDKFHPDIEVQRVEWMEKFPYEKLAELKEFVSNFEPDNAKLLGYPKDYFGTRKTWKEYIDRVEYELDIIIKKGYPSYFLVFADIMQYCRDNGIVVSTRGSAAGSIVGYLMNINILDPLIYNLPFERFLNPLRPSAPDIDGDFADDRRDEVIKYISEKYGKENVSQIITFGTMLPRAAVRDVGRVLGVAYKKCDRLSKLIPNAPQGKKTTFAWALETSEEFKDVYEKDEEASRIIDIAKKIEGNYRHASSHAAGVMVAPTKLSDYAPLQWDSDHQMPVIQYDMKVAEKVGLVKLDILGIRNLAILGNAIDLAEKRKHNEIDLLKIDVHDKKAFELLSKGRTIGLFQLSGTGMTKWMLDLEPERVEDLMAMVALYRPGPMANIPEYIKRKKNPRTIKYYVPQMKEWMETTYGILVYQDDLLYTVINLAGYDWLEADNFRKGVGKKIQSVLDKQHKIFVDGCQSHSGLSKEKAEEIWEIMVPFAAYGFNKAHASSYGMVAYWTAYMKAEYTAEFMTALMTAEASNLDKIAAAIKECVQMGIEVLPPDINKSFNSFSIEDDKTIRYGLDSVKNLGSDVIEFMISERKKEGEFKDVDDFLERMSAYRGFNKRSLEALIWSGCLDSVGEKLKIA